MLYLNIYVATRLLKTLSPRVFKYVTIFVSAGVGGASLTKKKHINYVKRRRRRYTMCQNVWRAQISIFRIFPYYVHGVYNKYDVCFFLENYCSSPLKYKGNAIGKSKEINFMP